MVGVSIPVVIVPAKDERTTLVFTFERLKDDLSAIVNVSQKKKKKVQLLMYIELIIFYT